MLAPAWETGNHEISTFGFLLGATKMKSNLPLDRRWTTAESPGITIIQPDVPGGEDIWKNPF